MAINVIDAVWGSKEGSIDVTPIVTTLTSPPLNIFTIAANSATLGDPSPGIHKHLTVRYMNVVGGVIHTAACEEGQVATLSQLTTISSISVIGAVYGAEQGSEDVTTTVQELVDSGVTKITADDNTFGDPAPGHLKNFGMLYLLLGVPGVKARSCQEGETVEIT